MTIETFKSSIEGTLSSRSKVLLGADFGLSARRPLSEIEQNQVDDYLAQKPASTKTIEIFSMVLSPLKESRLVQIKAIEPNYPFYGEIELQENQNSKALFKKTGEDEAIVWVYPEILQQMGLSIGDQLKIGEMDFVIADVVIADSAASITNEMAPRLYMSYKNIYKTKLIQKGTIAWHSQLYQLQSTDQENIDLIRSEIFKKIDNPDVNVFTHKSFSEQTARLITRLNDFLGLSSIVALFLSAVGSAFLFRSYLRSKFNSIAILICLGATRSFAFYYYLFQSLILGLMSSLIALTFSFMLLGALKTLTIDLIPLDIDFKIKASTLILLLIWGPLLSVLIGLPQLLSLHLIKPKRLLSQASELSHSLNWMGVLSSLPLFMTLIALAIWLSRSYWVGSVFALLFALSALILSLISIFIFRAFNKWFSFQSLSLRWAVRDLNRQKTTTTLSFICLGLSALLISLIPILKTTLDEELSKPQTLPSLFMFDIQPDQLSELNDTVKDQGQSIEQVSPMIRARLTSVNGEIFDKGSGKNESQLTREQQDEMRFRNRGFNLSFREKLSPSETIVSGVDFSGPFDSEKSSTAEISVEERFAQRLGLKIGDELTFDIESVPVVGRIINLRKVKWTSFQPNFFVQFQPGVLDAAPQTLIATVGQTTDLEKINLQNQIVKKFSNISVVDVSRVVDRLLKTMDQMSWALLFMSILCFLSGLVVLYSMASHQAYSRSWEVGLLKALGSSFQTIEGLFLWQFGMIAMISSLVGGFIAMAMGYLFSYFLFF